MISERREVVVGGGQAGLALGFLLGQQGRSVTILEAADTPAAAWRGRRVPRHGHDPVAGGRRKRAVGGMRAAVAAR